MTNGNGEAPNGIMWPPPGAPPGDKGGLYNPLQAQLSVLAEKLDKLAAGQDALQSSMAQGFLDMKSQMSESGMTTGPSLAITKSMSPRAARARQTLPTKPDKTSSESQDVKGVVAILDDPEKDFAMEKKLKEIVMLKGLFELTETLEIQQAALDKKRQTFAGNLEIMQAMNLNSIEMCMDSAMAFVIVSNAIFLWIDADFNGNRQSAICNGINYFFSIAFIFELVAKLKIFGWRKQYCEDGKFSNTFDLLLITMDVFQNAMALLKSSIDFPSTVLRLARLARIGRILRLFHLPMFENLLAMISGLIGGLPTLCWSILLFAIVIYVLSLIFRQTIGLRYEEEPDIAYYFEDVPRAMFTVFRCSFGDCSTNGGVPLFELVHTQFGWAFTAIYCGMVFIVTVGLFNVISAIFVESTMAAAAAGANQARGERLQNHELWARSITQLVRVTWRHMKGPVPLKISDYAVEVRDLDVETHIFEELVNDPEFSRTLDALDINPDDHRYLADILDPDNGGSVTICDIVDGLARLRGDPRRSDIVAVDLMVRSLQGQIGEILEAVKPPLSRTTSKAASALNV